MARNTIDLNQINARLRDMSKPQLQLQRDHYDYDDDSVSYAQFREVDVQYDEEEGGTSNSTFYASIIGLFLMIGGGTFFSSDILALFPKKSGKYYIFLKGEPALQCSSPSFPPGSRQ